MHFLSPIWFVAIAAVIIPLVIHLWNIKAGKTLKVGSIALMGEASRQSSRSLKLLDILLLILRCLILVLLAFILAMPFLSRLADNSKIKGWVMLPKSNFKETYARFKKPIDSLITAGYEFHYFDEAFTKVTLPDVLKDTSKTIDSTVANYWDILTRLNTKAPAKFPVYLFTDNGINHFGGSKPAITTNLQWQTYTPTDSLSEWVDKAWFTNDNNIMVVKGISTPHGTTYTSYNLQPGQSNTLFNTILNNNGASVSLKSKAAQSIVADTSAFHIAVVADNGQVDATYLNAALKAVAPLVPHKVVMSNYANAIQIKQKQDWVFWLSKKPVDKAAGDIASNLFIYQTGKTVNINTTIQDDAIPLSTLISDADTAPSASADLVWKDGFGHPVLALEKTNATNLYRCYTRFNPAWGDLVWNDNFPKMLLGLMVKDEPSPQSIKYDKRVMSSAQIMPLVTTSGKQTLAGIADDVDLSHYLWLVLVLLFLTERFLSHKKPIVSNG